MPPIPDAIVLVDDDEDAPFFFRRLLASAGVTTRMIPIPDGRGALSFFQRAANPRGGIGIPLIAFLNVHMPGAGGLEVLRWIRSHEALDAMPVAMTSDSDEFRLIEEAARCGAQAYIRKFPAARDLRRIVDDATRFPAARSTDTSLFSFRCNLLSCDSWGAFRGTGTPFVFDTGQGPCGG